MRIKIVPAGMFGRDPSIHNVNNKTPFQLLPEPANRFDPLAILVLAWGKKLGYVAKLDYSKAELATRRSIVKTLHVRYVSGSPMSKDLTLEVSDEAELSLEDAHTSIDSGMDKGGKREEQPAELLPQSSYNNSTLLIPMMVGIESITFQPKKEAIAKRDELLRLCGYAKSALTTINERDALAVLFKDLASFNRQVEGSRVTVKAAPLKLAKLVDDTAAQLSSLTEQQEKAFGRAIAEFDLAEQSRVNKAQQKTWEDQQTLEKQKAELEKKADNTRTEAGAARVEAKLAEVNKELAAVNAPVTFVSASVSGVSVKSDIEFEVTDVVALYEAQPALVELKPIASAIKKKLKELAEGQSIPGVKHWKVGKASKR